MSYCYLICFGRSIGNPASRHGQAGHYLGYTSKSMKQRLEQHRAGTGAKITKAAAKDYGCDLKIVRYWRNGSRAMEQQLKRRHSSVSYCPFCCR